MSWEAGSTIFGIGLALFSLVAPMMGLSLPRGLLVVLLGMSILLIVVWPASFIMGWLQDYHKLERSTGLLVFGVIGAVLGALVFGRIWLSTPSQTPPPQVSQIDRNKLHIFIVRTPGYMGATNGPKEEDMHRYIVSSEPLILGSQEKSFAWGIDNENASALRDARLNFYYWGKMPLQITRTHLAEEGHYWQEYTAGHHYFYEFKKPINERWAHSWGALIIKFPKPGEYRFDLTASGEGIETVNPIKTYLIVNVSDLAFPQKQPLPGVTK